ncbi:MAG: hypothetical protein LAT56_15490 [Wenzhouxiangella sp.]|nr:hypothetical protein [Wenzhouxiangella sp.]
MTLEVGYDYSPPPALSRSLKFKTLTLLFSSLLIASSAYGSSQLTDGLTDAEIEGAALALDRISTNTPVLSTYDLLEHLQRSVDCNSPLLAFSKEGLEAFINSLVFTSHGLASWRYDVLAEELSERQIYEVMRLFGRQYHNPLVDERLLSPNEQILRSATASLYQRFGVIQDAACAVDRCVFLELSTCDQQWCQSWTPPPLPPWPWPPTFPTSDPSEILSSCF